MTHVTSHRKRRPTLNVDGYALLATVVWVVGGDTRQIFTGLVDWLLMRGTRASYRKAKVVLGSLSTANTKVVDNAAECFFLTSLSFKALDI